MSFLHRCADWRRAPSAAGANAPLAQHRFQLPLSLMRCDTNTRHWADGVGSTLLGGYAKLRRCSTFWQACVLLFTATLCFSITAATDDDLQPAIDDRVVQTMTKFGYGEEQVRKEVGKGCGGGASGDIAICAAYSYHTAAVALNDKYLEVLSRLAEPTARVDLQMAQAAWNEYQDAQCRFDTTAWTGGSFRQVATAMCRESISMNRTQQLSEFFKCDSEDPDCPALHTEPVSLSK